MFVHRRLTIATGAALLSLAVTGCSGLGRSMVGTVSYETGRGLGVRVTSPSVKGCHRLAPAGATKVENSTLVDMRLYRTRNCDAPHNTYLPSNSGDEIAPGTLPWRSYSVIH
ncbi:hypothetical protein ACIRSU_28710 [Streptomyces sp. NPDC101160]|uniref:hypothetical protein n=1 Tax=Streptomyces sp. NPDC101160 TaxID=3366118 RepID=UPI0038024755